MMETASALRPSDREAIASLVVRDPFQKDFLTGLALSATPSRFGSTGSSMTTPS